MEPSGGETLRLLHQLPEELLQHVLSYSNASDQKALSLTSRWCHRQATSLLWQRVELVDRHTRYSSQEVDEHDDTPIIKRLIILATNPQIASAVQTLTHRCHLPPPAIFNELPWNRFSSPCLSTDPRTVELVRRAVANMTKLQTLRIVFGHPTLSDALIRCFFDVDRKKELAVRRLWLENVRLGFGGFGDWSAEGENPYKLPLQLSFYGLESIRYRRLPMWVARMHTSFGRPVRYRVYLRGFSAKEPFNTEKRSGLETLQNGEGGLYETPVGTDRQVDMAYKRPDKRASLDEDLMRISLECYFDDKIYQKISRDPNFPSDMREFDRGDFIEPPAFTHFHLAEKLADVTQPPEYFAAITPLSSASHTLTSINLDWVLAGLKDDFLDAANSDVLWPRFLDQLFSLRFPRLRSFQLRNAVTPHTALPKGFYLLDQSDRNIADPDDRNYLTALEFMEAHPNLKSLAWPMDQFFSDRPQPPTLVRRADAVIDRLALTLTDLRIDTLYSGNGESQTEDDWTGSRDAANCRKSFISRFAAKMTNIAVIKIEGGMPRDERREVIRALGLCPLRKIVMIGLTSPIGNTWGPGGRDLPDALSVGETSDLEGEDKDAVFAIGPTRPAPPADKTFTPNYGWPPSPPMLHTIASYHASTITELKFCGYKGSACLYDPTPITLPLLAPLKHFHKLETLVLSTWLSTLFEHETHDQEIISYWLNSRKPSATALVLSDPTDADLGPWGTALRDKFSASALAKTVLGMFGPLLSEQAKGARRDGVKIRTSFCLGDWGGIFDFDVFIGKGGEEGRDDVVLGYEGPREELEPTRRREKLENRRWFY